MSAPCTECGHAASWWWKAPEARTPAPLCDDHAADKDLDELSELGSW